MIGSYIGADGRTYRWERGTDCCHVVVCEFVDGREYRRTSDIYNPDWPAAKAALDALLEAGEWVEIEVAGYTTVRVKCDGSEPQYSKRTCDGKWAHYGWEPEGGNDLWPAAYRAQLEAAERERDEAEQAYKEALYDNGALRDAWYEGEQQLLAENRLLREALEHCYLEYGACCQGCPMRFESANEDRCLVGENDDPTPLTAAEVERVNRLEKVAEAAWVRQEEHDKWVEELNGKVCWALFDSDDPREIAEVNLRAALARLKEASDAESC